MSQLRQSLLQRGGDTLLGRRAAARLVDRFEARLHGAANLPKTGGALLVGNHALLGIDAFPLTALLALETGRIPRFLGERNLFRVPVLRSILGAVGAIPGEPERAVRLLAEGEIVAVYPGGVDDSFKLESEAYTLKWGDRAGFARVAMRAGVPIVPVAATGVDEVWDVARREHVVGRLALGSSRYDLPIVRTPLPRHVPLDYHLLAPVDTSGDAGDPEAVERVRRATFEAVDAVLARYREGQSAVSPRRDPDRA